MKTSRLTLALLAVLALTAAMPSSESNMHVRNGMLVTTHALKYRISGPPHWRLSQPETRTATFDGHPYAVTVAAFIGTRSFVMVHAERVLDHSGASNYENLTADTLDGVAARSQVQCAEVSADDVAGEHDLNYLTQAGFQLLPAVLLKQYFLTTADHNAEIVVSLGRRVKGCGVKVLPEAARQRLLQAIAARVHLRPAGDDADQ